MAAVLLDGKKVAESVRAEVRAGVTEFFARHGRAPELHVVVVGDDPASLSYTKSKEKAANDVGMRGELHALPTGTGEEALVRLVSTLNAEETVDGILVQLPLPAPLHDDRVVEHLSPDKDVDGIHPYNVGRLAIGRPTLVPCTPLGVMRLLDAANTPVEGKRAVVVGRSNLVGRPVAALLVARDATVTLAHSRTQDLASLCREAEILVVAAGVPELVRGDWIKPGAVVIDVGNTFVEKDGKRRVVGDVAFDEAKERASAITPVPGGVGPMTIACLLENTLRAAQRRCEGV